MQWSTSACLLAVLLLQLQGPVVDASFWDTIPIWSQGKSMVQLISGDTKGAQETQDNFINQMPLVSQVKSVVELATGNSEAALKTQKRFLNNAETMVDGTPGVGHIKGGIHMLAGDEENGLNIIRGATSNTGTTIGGFLGGPVGAVVGRIATDMMITNIDTAATVAKDNQMEFKPYGIVDYVMNVDKKSVDEHIEAISGVTMDAARSKKGKVKVASAMKPKYN